MPKIPYKAEKSQEEDEDYEIVSFEDFCDKSPGSKTDLLTLNDNINYRLCYESDKSPNFADKYGEPSNVDAENHTETSLNDSKNVTFKRKLSNSFAPFGRSNAKSGKAPLFSAVIPKARNEGESSSREHRYQRFSEQRNWLQRSWELIASAGPGMLGVALVCALCVGAWWAASGALGGAWGEEHYRKLWERAHPDNTKKPPTPMTYEKILPEYRYHDHNNLSTKNKSNGTEFTRKNANLNKKSFIDRPPEVLKDICAKVEDNMRFDCFPQANANENDCIKRGCCWRLPEQKGGNIPYCFYPPQYDSFRFLNMTEDKHSVTVYYEKARPSGYPDDFEVARIDFKYMSDDTLQIKIYDADNKRFEPPLPEIATNSQPLSDMKYRVEINASTVGFKVVRNSNNVTILDTQDVGGLILSDKFLQLSAVLSTKHIFGLGERRAKFLVDMNWQTFALFNRDRAPVEHQNLYGTHPFFLGVEPQGDSFGVLLLNSNAMDVVTQPAPGVTFRAVGGVLTLLVTLGGGPAHVAAQHARLVGPTFMPPYWALGFHLCKFNYMSLNTTREVWKKNRDAGIPFDVQWNDIDYMKNRNDFTYDEENFAGLPAFVDELHKEGMHYMIIIDPGVSASEKVGTYPPYDRGIEMNVFVKNATDQPFIGKVWNTETTVFPDFTHPNATQYWLDMMTDFHKKVKYDGAWIDMNEPSNMLDGIKEGQCADERFPYMPHTGDALLRTHTICMDAKQYAGEHYDLHNLYGLYEAVATNFALSDIRGKRPFVISRSTFLGSGKFTGHWSGDIDSTWHDMRMTIPELLNFNLFGIPMMGADICGFRGNTTLELCKRWMQLGAFYPFSRNHNSDTSSPQDPVSLGPEVVSASRSALRLRYRLLPYYYTLFYRAHLFGESVVTPLFYDDPKNVSLYDIDDQFMVGPHVMVSPILQPGVTTTAALFPSHSRWYHIMTGANIPSGQRRDVTEDQIVTVKGGGILPLQEPPLRGPVTTTNTRSQPLQLLAAPNGTDAARGELYWDDGDSLNNYDEKKFSHIEFELERNVLRSNVIWWGFGVPSINNITVFNQPTVVSVSVDGTNCVKSHCQFAYVEKFKVLHIFRINLALDKPFEVKWLYKAKHNKAIAINSPAVSSSG
ncbi:unnamed protein product [Chilo suppressalis]|uniref:P-type domain-containing protein n=1 Tax=Chilo suppressalis TaxID=168631 RepID=A0ABN8AXD5_CHISP|nr:unnamed protein product [Chilo suppressalis]